jgi:hemoglobin-like flavoprotein
MGFQDETGIRHKGYGVAEQHYEAVAAALQWTLGQRLGDAFTPEVKAAWVSANTILAETMKPAARAASAYDLPRVRW